MSRKATAQRRRAYKREAQHAQMAEDEKLTSTTEQDNSKQKDAKQARKKEKLAKKNAKPGIFAKLSKFAKSVVSELHRVTWPSREDVIQWSGVVIGALIFFGVYIALLDTGVTQLLMAYVGLGQ